MNSQQKARFDQLYTSHLNHLTLQGKRPATIDAYARAVRRITAFFDCPPDRLSLAQLKTYFVELIASHSWSTNFQRHIWTLPEDQALLFFKLYWPAIF